MGPSPGSSLQPLLPPYVGTFVSPQSDLWEQPVTSSPHWAMLGGSQEPPHIHFNHRSVLICARDSGVGRALLGVSTWGFRDGQETITWRVNRGVISCRLR